MSPVHPDRPDPDRPDPDRRTEPLSAADAVSAADAADRRTEPLRPDLGATASGGSRRPGRLTTAEAEALLAGGGPGPLREVLAAASAPARRHELLGQEAAVAAFVSATATLGTDPAVPAATGPRSWRERWADRPRLRRPARIALAVALGLATAGAAAAAVALSTPPASTPPPPADLVRTSVTPTGAPGPSRPATQSSWLVDAPAGPPFRRV